MKQIFSGTIGGHGTPTKFVSPLTDEERQRLKEIHRADANWRTSDASSRHFAQRKGFPLDQLAAIFDIDRDAVSQWLDWWAEYKFEGLTDDPRSGESTDSGQPDEKTKH